MATANKRASAAAPAASAWGAASQACHLARWLMATHVGTVAASNSVERRPRAERTDAGDTNPQRRRSRL
jgi:hypothetical protein